MYVTSTRSAAAPALYKYWATLSSVGLAGPSQSHRFSTLPFGSKDSDEGTMSKDAIRNDVAKEAQEGEGTYLRGQDQTLTGDPATPQTDTSASGSAGPAQEKLASAHSNTSVPPDTDVKAAKEGQPQFHGSDAPADHGATIDVPIEAEADMRSGLPGGDGSSRQRSHSQPAGADLSRNPDMQSQAGDLAQPTAAEAAKEQDEFNLPQMAVDRPDDMPEGTVPPTRGFDQSGMPSDDSPTQGEGLVNKGPGTSAGTTGAL